MNDTPPYWTDPGISEFKVTIKSVRKFDDRYHIAIEENVIRPVGGGQAGDRGRLKTGNLSVTIHDTIVDSGEVVLVTDEALTEGDKGQLDIDMEWRSSMMRNHTAEHLFVSIIKSQYENISVGQLWIDGRHGSVELIGVGLDYDTIFEAETGVMRIIEQDIPVKSDYVDSSSLDQSVRSREGLTDKHSKLRVVSVGDMDSSACSGIHVTRTSDIGFFKVLDVKMSEKTTHVEFVAGLKAAVLISSLYNVILQRKYSYPFEMEQLGAVLDRAKLAIEDKQKLIEKTTQLITRGATIELVADVSFRYEYLPGYDASSLKILANQLSTAGPTVILLFAPGSKSQVILRVNEMVQEASKYISDSVTRLGGKGGGKGDIFTGGFVDVEDPKRLYESLVVEVRKLIS